MKSLVGYYGLSGTTDGTGSNARFNGVAQIAVDTNLVIYVADYGGKAVRKVTTSGLIVA
jgi:hypothetical protein